jgi:hypothetical protein
MRKIERDLLGARFEGVAKSLVTPAVEERAERRGAIVRERTFEMEGREVYPGQQQNENSCNTGGNKGKVELMRSLLPRGGTHGMH